MSRLLVLGSRNRKKLVELEELLADLAELGGDLAGREVADFFRSHDGALLKIRLRPRRRRAR